MSVTGGPWWLVKKSNGIWACARFDNIGRVDFYCRYSSGHVALLCASLRWILTADGSCGPIRIDHQALQPIRMKGFLSIDQLLANSLHWVWTELGTYIDRVGTRLKSTDQTHHSRENGIVSVVPIRRAQKVDPGNRVPRQFWFVTHVWFVRHFWCVLCIALLVC